jgi:hypothetical protein
MVKAAEGVEQTRPKPEFQMARMSHDRPGPDEAEANRDKR